MTTQAMLQRLTARELPLCRRINRLGRRRSVERFFAGVSRLGDGVFWYALMLLLPFAYGPAAWETVMEMALAGMINLAVYRRLKGTTLRQRPFRMDAGIRLGTPPLDAYSFPSGHTMHAVGFSTVLVTQIPALGWLVIPFTLLVALSRIILGLHYPSDVAAGALLGAATALAVGMPAISS
ncbi:MAG: phosphatase PAP2 family protein [Gammaproteobacteria bacterium]|nr:phosphatase PAP2 family protein [Gammaproteobacteria bacterium]